MGSAKYFLGLTSRIALEDQGPGASAPDQANSRLGVPVTPLL